MYADFFFCVLVVFPSFRTSWRLLCRLDVDDSLIVASQTPSIRDFLTPKLNKIPCLLFILKFKSVGLLNIKNHGTWVSEQALTHCNAKLRRNSIQYYQISELDSDCLDHQFQWKIFLYSSLLIGHTDICNTDVISFRFESRGYTAHCCNQLAGNFYDRS